MIEKVIFLIVYIAEALIAYLYFNDNYKMNKKPIISVLISFVLYVFGFILNVSFNNNMIVNSIVFLIINLIYSNLIFDISFKGSILHTAILWAIMTLSELIVETGSSLLIDIPIDDYRNNISSLVTMAVVEKVLYLVVCKIISTAFSYNKRKIKNKIKNNFALFLYPLITTIILLVFSYTSAIYKFNDKINLIFILTSIISLIFCCLIFIINQKIQVQEDELIDLKAEQQKYEIDQTFYNLLEKKNEEQCHLVHDIKNHLSYISKMESIEKINQYLSKIHIEMPEYKFIGKSQNKMLDLILSKYCHICETNNIHFTADVKSCNLSFIDDVDLSTIVGNLLDNAVEAARGTPNPRIRFIAKADQSFNVLTINNSSSHPPKHHGEKLYTTKPDSFFHGHGVNSVERVAKKYNAICNWHYENDSKEFYFTIVFNKNEG